MTIPGEISNSEPALPLSGYRALDLAGPTGVYCGKLLADMGSPCFLRTPTPACNRLSTTFPK